jgi:FtsP/CotA-like multicopper oxidase with cupredoxin domain
MTSTRRGFLTVAGGAALAAIPISAAARPHDHGPPPEGDEGHSGGGHSGGGHAGGGGENGATFRGSAGVDHVANGFDPRTLLRDFDYGTVTVGADGRTVRDWEIIAEDKEIEVAPGVRFPAWTFNGRIPGPTLRCTQGDLLRVRFVNRSQHPHTMHFHGVHPADMDGVPMIGRGIIAPGEEFTYTFDAQPLGLHLYHCHVGPLAEHIARGMYGTFIVDPPGGRPPADELVMVQHGYNTTFDGEGNQLYAVNGIPFVYMNDPIRVRRGELVRIYLVNILEYDPINSFHLHGNFFDYYPTGTRLEPAEFTDTVMQAQGQRGICELRFPTTGRFMFHAHKTEFADLGWMGLFDVVDEATP